MNKQQFEIIKMLEGCSADKAKFLRNLLNRASQGYDYAVERDAQSLGGELSLIMVSEGHGTYYGKKNVSRWEQRGGELYTGINHKFREQKTIKDFDWSSFGPESLYEK